MNEIVPLKPRQRDQAAGVLAAAFADYGMWAALFPDTDERNRFLPSMWRGVVAYCQRYGTVETTRDVTGVAGWIKPGYANLTLWRHIRSEFLLPRAVMMLTAKARLRFLRVMSHTEKIHRRLMSEPHWYLWALGVDPIAQSTGIGANLLRSGISYAQLERAACYLETNTKKNVDFYCKRGFGVLFEDRPFPGDLRQWYLCRPADRALS
ncbi:GNAT family N-acetyltransferase [Candidatus Bipolaricaulota bacterium]|nr:GNAT family N-acetyltransferase [Candidatus Bipolaricaulota bacterium]